MERKHSYVLFFSNGFQMHCTEAQRIIGRISLHLGNKMADILKALFPPVPTQLVVLTSQVKSALIFAFVTPHTLYLLVFLCFSFTC